MTTQEKNAINFLLFSYFGITLDDGNDKLLFAAIQKAYNDATQQGAFNTEVSKEIRESSLYAKSKGIYYIRNAVQDLICSDSINDEGTFNTWHEKTCGKLLGIYKNINVFTLGNAQKWVNMTLKYLYILNIVSAMSGEDSVYEEIKNLSEFLHAPVDSYIIEAVWDENNKGMFPLIEEKLCKGGTIGAYNSEKVESWSNWKDYEAYMKFQNGLRDIAKRENQTLIDRETPKWIEVAKERKEIRFSEYDALAAIKDGCVDIPNWYTRIEKDAFQKVSTELKKVIIPNSVKKICNGTFQNCHKLKEIERN